jgi:hypothetical protein
MPYIPGTGWKKIILYINDASHADLRLKLKYHDLSQSEFLRTVIDAMIEENPNMMKLIQEKLDLRTSMRKKKKISKDIFEKNETERDFALNQDEIENIFDILEKESGEL